MVGKISKRTNQDQPRVRLENSIPLETPFVLMVDPSSACNLRCLFCPTGNTSLIASTGRYQGYMNLGLYEKVIRDLDQFDGVIKTLRLYKEGEPLVNPHFPEFVQIARNSKKIDRIDTTTNGILLNQKLSEKIIAGGINQINISINGMSENQYKNLTKVSLNFDRMVDEISYLFSIRKDCEIYIKAISENLNEKEKEEFFERFTPISDRIFLENIQPNWPKFSFDYIKPDYKVGHYGQPLEDREVCPYIFYMMVINSDGSVSACVQDWSHELIIGDVRREAVKAIWLGDRLRGLQRLHLEKKRCENSSCSICPVLRHGSLDNIDQYASDLLLKLGQA